MTRTELEAQANGLRDCGKIRAQLLKARSSIIHLTSAPIKEALGYWDATLKKRRDHKYTVQRQTKIIIQFWSDPSKKLRLDLASIADQFRPSLEGMEAMLKPIDDRIVAAETTMRKLARQFPVRKWSSDIIDDLGLACVIAEAGMLDKYPTHSALWKRLGLAPFTKGGKCMAPNEWMKRKGLGPDDWIAAGYSPNRRAIMFSVGDLLIGNYRPLVNGNVWKDCDINYYQRLYAERLRYQVAKHPAYKRPASSDGRENYSRHAECDAHRYVEKRFVKQLYQAWKITTPLST